MPVTIPGSRQVSRARREANNLFNEAFRPVRTPFYAAVGVGDLAVQSINDVLSDVRNEVNTRVEGARTTVVELPDELGGLRNRLEREQLSKQIEEYRRAAESMYGYLARQGRKRVDRLSQQPQIKWVLDVLDDSADAAQRRTVEVLDATAERVEDLSSASRTAGRTVAREVSETTGDAAEAIEEAGEQLAEQARAAGEEAAQETTVRRTPEGTKAAAKAQADEETTGSAPSKTQKSTSGNAGTSPAKSGTTKSATTKSASTSKSTSKTSTGKTSTGKTATGKTSTGKGGESGKQNGSTA